MARILVIEDERDIRDLYRRMLTDAGHIVDVAPDGVAALKMVAGSTYDVLLLDIIMPKKDGIETMAALAKDYPTVKVIIITGGGLHLDAQDCMDMAKSPQCVMKLKKPVREETLLDAVTKALLS